MQFAAKHKRSLVISGIILAAVPLLCAWLFGWGRGDIDAIPYSAQEIDRVELSTTALGYERYRASVTDRADIQALVDSLNSFQHTGSGLKDLFKYGVGAGGTTLYVCDIVLSNGGEISLHFGSNSGEQPYSDMELSYWIHGENSGLFGNTCRGSLELFLDLFQKYSPEK